MKNTIKYTLAASAVALLAACGGGGSSENNTAPSANTAPVSNAGQIQNILVGATVTLNGSNSSDANNDALTYSWTLTSKPSGSSATLSSATSAMPTFTADAAGAYVASLVVNDGKENSTASTVTVNASVANAAPVANAGTAQNVTTRSVVTLNGSNSSDANNDALTYSWTLTSKPTGSTAALSSATAAMPTFTADVAGAYVASLVVNDGKVSSTAVTVNINATVANAAPVANAGTAQNAIAGATVTLDGSNSSDANGDALSYSWTLTSKPNGSTATISSSTAIKPSFVADLAGTYVASLKVNDGKLDSSVVNVSVSVTQPKVIGTSYKATNGMSVTLTSFTSENLGNGYTRYTATYKQQNDTAIAIDEGTLKLYFSNAEPQSQYGFFNRVLPGESFSLTRSYSWEVLSTSVPSTLQYHEDHFFASNPITGSLQWLFPIK